MRMQESLFMDESYASVHEALHDQAKLLLAGTGSTAGNMTALDCVLPGLLSAVHLDYDNLSRALMHIGCTVTPATLQSSSRSIIMSTIRSAITSAAQQRGVPLLAVAAQLSQRYHTLCTSANPAIGLFDAPMGDTKAFSGMNYTDRTGSARRHPLTAPVVIRRGLGVSTLGTVMHPGVQMLQHVGHVVDKKWHMRALLQAAAAAAGPVMLRWPLWMVPAADVPLRAACVAVARAVVLGVPSDLNPVSPSDQKAQVSFLCCF
jgi:hypothetical protein